MITLVANTVTKLIKAEKRDRVFQIVTNSADAKGTRIGYSPDAIGDDLGLMGFQFTISSGAITFHLPAGEEIFAIDSSTASISLGEVYGQVSNCVKLY